MQKHSTPKKPAIASASALALREAEEMIGEARDYFRLVEMASEVLIPDDRSAFQRATDRGNDKLVEALLLISRVRIGDIAEGEFHACD